MSTYCGARTIDDCRMKSFSAHGRRKICKFFEGGRDSIIDGATVQVSTLSAAPTWHTNPLNGLARVVELETVACVQQYRVQALKNRGDV